MAHGLSSVSPKPKCRMDPARNSTSVGSGAIGIAGTGQAFGNQGRSIQYGLQLLF